VARPEYKMGANRKLTGEIVLGFMITVNSTKSKFSEECC